MAERKFRGLFWSLVVLGLLLDQGTKYGVFHWLYTADEWGGQKSYNVISGAFEILTQFRGEKETGTGVLAFLRTLGGSSLPAVNEGALFGLGRQHRGLANSLFALVSMAAAILIGYWGSFRLTRNDGILAVALGLIMSGALGNLFDRVVFGGVRDFLHFYWFEWPVFNVADCCLVCGAGLLLIQAYWVPQSAASSTSSLKKPEMAEMGHN